MALNLHNINKIRAERKNTVYGYIREEFGDDIPNGVILVCLLFYGNKLDQWDKTNIAMAIKSDEEGIMTHLNPDKATSTFLTEEVDSDIHSWKFKVVKCTNHNYGTMRIGIWDVSKNEGIPPFDEPFNYRMHGREGYAFYASNGKVISCKENGFWKATIEYGEECPDGTLVDMKVDFNELSLSFMINGKDYGKAYGIKPGKYRAAVYLYFEDDSIQFIEKYLNFNREQPSFSFFKGIALFVIVNNCHQISLNIDAIQYQIFKQLL